MLTIVGVIIVLVMVFGGYVLAGGKFGVILKAMPFELMMIGGAGLGSYVVANSARAVQPPTRSVLRLQSQPTSVASRSTRQIGRAHV